MGNEDWNQDDVEEREVAYQEKMAMNADNPANIRTCEYCGREWDESLDGPMPDICTSDDCPSHDTEAAPSPEKEG